MVVIEVELLSGRYHAHLWGESQFGMAGPEWPPSPWRLLRALASAWFTAKPHPSPEVDRDALLETLGRADPPEIWLPRASFHELRYYQPVVRSGEGDRVLHHDFYAIPEGGRFWFRLNVALTEVQRTLLDALLSRLRYFGRTESQARLRVVDRTEPPPAVRRVAPRSTLQLVDDVVYRPVLCTAPDFRASDLWAVRNGTNPAGGYPLHLVDTLLSKKMPLPCGARWVEYAVPGEILVHEIRPRAQPTEPDKHVGVAEIRFRLCRRIPIPLQLLIPIARAFRNTAVDRHKVLVGAHSVTLTGREADGSIARGHRHAYYLPRLSRRWVIETLIVRVPTGCLTSAELNALLSVDHIRVDGSPYPITVIPEEIVTEFTRPDGATRWVSMTPFLAPLRLSSQGHGTNVEEQLAVCAERLGVGRPVSVRKSNGPGGLGRVSSLLAHEYFNNDCGPSGRRYKFTRRLGFWLELTFDEPVVLDIPLGADAHFGAGQFKPC